MMGAFRYLGDNMKKIAILFSILLLGFIPVINTRASVNSYSDPQWTIYTGPFPTYAETELIDITDWESMVMYLDENIGIYTEFTVGSSDSRVSFWNNGSYVSDINLSELYNTSIGGNVWFQIPDGVNGIKVSVLLDGVNYSSSALDLLNSTWTELFTRSIADQTSGYQTGYQDGLNEGLSLSQQELDLAYEEGYTQGQLDSESDTTAVATFVPQVMSLAFGFFFQIFSIEVMGISFLQWFAALAGIGISFVIFKAILK